MPLVAVIILHALNTFTDMGQLLTLVMLVLLQLSEVESSGIVINGHLTIIIDTLYTL